ncbi:hypothetical protein GQ607_005901 [Colletotrichum asianum]|uniref:Secreted protein n=1 Tax=Colletotrichum asianum TaxID=702518 RepID=A0A8H3ZPF6_9PEZI|nr:hypothetical protein GQ607_005901 [Colletotrichum asianum]
MVWEVVLVLLLGRGCRTSRGERRLLGKNGRRHRSSMTLRRTILKKGEGAREKRKWVGGGAHSDTSTPTFNHVHTSMSMSLPGPVSRLVFSLFLDAHTHAHVHRPPPFPRPGSFVFLFLPSNSECDRCCLLIAHVPQDGLIQIASSGYLTLLPLAQDHVFHVAPASCDFRQVLRSYRTGHVASALPRPPSPRPARNAGTKVGRCFPHCALTDPGYPWTACE